MDELATLPSPLDSHASTELPPHQRARLAGWGNLALSSPTFVAQIGQPPFALPPSKWTHWPAWEPQGRLIAVPSHGAVLLMDAHNGRLVRTMSSPNVPAYHPCFSLDGKRIAAGTGNDVRIWNVDSGEQEHLLTGHKRPVWTALFSPDGTQLATCGWDGDVKLWNAVTGNELHTLKDNDEGVNGLAFSFDGKWLASAGHDKLARVWDTRTWTLLATLRGHSSWVQQVGFRPDGKVLATGAEKVMLWDTTTWNRIGTIAVPADGLLAFTPDGKTLVTAPEQVRNVRDRQLYRSDVATTTFTARIPLPGKTGWLGAELSADGRTVCLVSTEGPPGDGKHRVAISDAATGEELLSPERSSAAVAALAVSPDGRLLAAGRTDGTLDLWDLGTWARGQQPPTARTLARHAGAVQTLAFSPR